MSPFLRELYAQTSRCPLMKEDERAWGTDGLLWVMLTIRDLGPGAVFLQELWTPAEWRGRGYASRALTWLCGLADKHGYRIDSYVQPFDLEDPALSKRALAAWYRRHGFVVSRNFDMIRWPR